MNQPSRKSIRMKEYDYSTPGAYFITICTHRHQCMFGTITDGQMMPNDSGKLVYSEWMKTGVMRPSISLDAFVVMPNHIHGIIIIHSDSAAWHLGTEHRAPTVERFGKPTSNSIPTIIRGFKSAVTTTHNQRNNTPGFKLWQRNYWEHVIRNDVSMNQLREYIIFNPLKWKEDRFNPDTEP